MVYYNKEILIIDFQINYSKDYSFFIDDELCHLHIKANNGTYDYELEVDHQAETPRNLSRKKLEKEEWVMKFKIAATFLAILTAVYILFFTFYKKNWHLLFLQADKLSKKMRNSGQIYLLFNLDKYLSRLYYSKTSPN